VISCKQLRDLGYNDCGDTKETSSRAANAWWDSKLSTLKTCDTPPHPYPYIVGELEWRRDWAHRHGDATLASGYSASIENLNQIPPGELHESILREMFVGSEMAQVVWQDRLSREEVQAVPADKTIAGMAKRYVELFEARMKANDLSVGEYSLTQRCVNHFVEWVGPANPASVITPTRWEDYWKHLLNKVAAGGKYSVTYGKKDWSYARKFIHWMASMVEKSA
jgi:hypothetical protein